MLSFKLGEKFLEDPHINRKIHMIQEGRLWLVFLATGALAGLWVFLGIQIQNWTPLTQSGRKFRDLCVGVGILSGCFVAGWFLFAVFTVFEFYFLGGGGGPVCNQTDRFFGDC